MKSVCGILCAPLQKTIVEPFSLVPSTFDSPRTIGTIMNDVALATSRIWRTTREVASRLQSEP